MKQGGHLAGWLTAPCQALSISKETWHLYMEHIKTELIEAEWNDLYQEFKVAGVGW